MQIKRDIHVGKTTFCLFVWVFHPTRIFHSYGDVIIAGEGLQLLTYARDSWPLSSEGSLACHVCNGYLRGPVTLTPIAERLAVELPVLRLRSVAAWVRTLNLPLARRML